MKRWLIATGVLASIVAIVAIAGVAWGWWVNGHATLAEAAASKLPDEVPAFFRTGGKHLAHFSGDPDRWKNRETNYLRKSEEANHFLDTEDLDGKLLPATNRYDANKLMLLELKKDPSRVGMLPYAILENYERLMTGFADYRRSPDNSSIPMKCLVWGGTLAHYTGDAVMPLHTTRDYDGRIQPDKSVKQKGIHARIDAFPEKFGITVEEMGRGLEAKKIDDPWAHVQKVIAASYAEIPKCYEMDAAYAFVKPTEESRAFILSRCRVGAQLTLDLWYTAWLKSEKLPVPY